MAGNGPGLTPAFPAWVPADVPDQDVEGAVLIVVPVGNSGVPVPLDESLDPRERLLPERRPIERRRQLLGRERELRPELDAPVLAVQLLLVQRPALRRVQDIDVDPAGGEVLDALPVGATGEQHLVEEATTMSRDRWFDANPTRPFRPRNADAPAPCNGESRHPSAEGPSRSWRPDRSRYS